MNTKHEEELRRLAEILRSISSVTSNPEQLEALRMGAAALNLAFVEGRWKELAELNSPLNNEMREHLRALELDPDRSKR